MATIHKGMINGKLKNSLKDSGLNNYDLATTKLYKGVVPMWEQLGFLNDSFDVPNQDIYWKNHIPKNFNYFNLSNISTEHVLIDSKEPYLNDTSNPKYWTLTELDEGVGVGVYRGSKTKRTSYTKIVIDDSSGSLQQWDNGYLYPILPKIDKFGVFTEAVDTGSYGSVNAPITNIEEITENIMLNVNFNKENTNDLEDLTTKNNIRYFKDFQIAVDENLRIKNNTIYFPDPLEKNEEEQAF